MISRSGLRSAGEKGGFSMDKARKWGCIAAFAVICLLAINFLGRFTDASTPLLGTANWENAEVVEADGTVRPVDVSAGQDAWDLDEGDQIRLTTRLPAEGEIPGLYEYAYLIMETGSGETVVLLDGEEYFRCGAQDMGQDLNFQQIHLTLPPDAAGKEMTVLFTPSRGDGALSPVFARFSSEYAADAFSAAYFNQLAIPAGAYSLGLVLVCAIFLVGLASGSPDWSLILLALAFSFTAARTIDQSSGYYFLSPGPHQFLSSNVALLAPAVLLVIYLILNRKRSFWRYLGRVTLGTLAAAAVYYGYSWITGGHFPATVAVVFSTALGGYPYALLGWLNTYLLAACGCIAAYGLLQSMVRIRSDAQALSLKNQLIMDNYRAIERNTASTAALRHDLNNQLTALRLLYEKGDLEGLGRRLGELGQELDRLRLPSFSDHFTVNALLQNAAAKAAQAHIRFQARAPLPAELPVDDGDLCSLLMNLLDNALEAAGRVEDPAERFVSVSLQVSQGFLAVSCRNSYAGGLLLDEKGWPKTIKEDESSHGFGLRQMETVARKYGSKLELSYDGKVFTVQTALKLNQRGKAASSPQ